MNDTQTLAERKQLWLAERRTLLTGTDAAQVLAMDADPELAAELGHFGGPMAVYLEKVGNGLPVEENAAMRAGRYLERPILDMYAERDPAHPVHIVYEPEWTLRRSPSVAFVGASLDAVRTDVGAPVDAKNLRRLDPQWWGEPGTDEIPLYYATQLVLEVHVTSAPYADLPVLVGGQELRVFRLYRDAELEANVLQRLYDFWHLNVLQRVPPPIDGSKAWAAHLKRAFRGAGTELLVATPDQHMAAQQLISTKRRLKELEETAASAENFLKNSIGDNKGLVGANWKALWSPVAAGTGTDWEAVTRDMVDELVKFLNQLRSRYEPAPGEVMRDASVEQLLQTVIARHQVEKRSAYRRFTISEKETTR